MLIKTLILYILDVRHSSDNVYTSSTESRLVESPALSTSSNTSSTISTGTPSKSRPGQHKHGGDRKKARAKKKAVVKVERLQNNVANNKECSPSQNINVRPDKAHVNHRSERSRCSGGNWDTHKKKSPVSPPHTLSENSYPPEETSPRLLSTEYNNMPSPFDVNPSIISPIASPSSSPHSSPVLPSGGKNEQPGKNVSMPPPHFPYTIEKSVPCKGKKTEFCDLLSACSFVPARDKYVVQICS